MTLVKLVKRRWSRASRMLSGGALIIAALLLAAINILVWYPGQANSDSDAQFLQISTGVLNDWHPPAMTKLWELLLYFGPGTAPIFVLNIFLYWTAPALIATTLVRVGNGIAGWIIILAVFAVPTFIMQNINITKDVHFATLLLTAFALVFVWRARGLDVPVAVTVIVTVMVAYAMLVRINAVFAVLPIIAYTFNLTWLRRPLTLALLTVPVALALVPVATIVNHRILLAHDAGAIRSLQLFDLGGIADRTGDMGVFGPASTLSYTELDRCYSPTMWDTLNEHGNCPDLVSRIGRRREDAFMQLPPLEDLWIMAIRRHPVAYVEHRLASFNSATYFVEPTHHFDALRVFDTAASRSPSLKNRVLDLIRYFPPLMPGVLLGLGVALTILLLGDRTLRERAEPFGLIALLLAALAYGFGFLLIGVATDLRYFFFSDLAILLAAVLTGIVLIAAWREPGRRRAIKRPLVFGIGVLAFVLVATLGARVTLHSPAPASKDEHPY